MVKVILYNSKIVTYLNADGDVRPLVYNDTSPEPIVLPDNTLLIEIVDSDAARNWVETNYNSGTFSYEKVNDTQYKITNTNTDWSSMFDDDERSGSNTYLLKILAAGDTSSVTHMNYMFYNCSSLESVSLFDTSNVTNMIEMFSVCTSLTTVPLFDTSNVTKIYGMFGGCTSLTTVPQFNTQNVTEMGSMFYGCTSLTMVPLFDTSNVTYMSHMFNGCTKVESGALALYQQASATGKVEYYEKAFYNCGIDTETGLAELQQIPESWGGLVLSDNTLLIEIVDSDAARNWVETNYNSGTFSYEKVSDTQYKITNTNTDWSSMFDDDERSGSNTYLLKILAAGDTSSVTDMTSMFYRCSSLESVPLFDTSNVTDMSNMFADCISLTTVPLFNTSNVTDMEVMFSGCTSLTAVTLFDTSNVTMMDYMFYGCKKVETGALALYQQASATGKVDTYSYAFLKCGKDTETGLEELQQIPESWGGLKPEVGAMSVKIEIVNSADARNWVETNTKFESYEKLSDTQYIVTQTNPYWDGLFRITDTAGWPIDNPYLTKVIKFGDISRVDEMGHMFDSCVELISVPATIDTSNVTNAEGMFSNCSKLTKLPLLTYKAGMNVSYLFNGCENATIGLLVNYNDMDDAGLSIMYMRDVFTNCGTNGGTHALEERAQIPMEIGGDKLPDNTLLFRFEQAQSSSGPAISNDGTWRSASDDGKYWYWTCDKSDWSNQFAEKINTAATQANIVAVGDTSMVTNMHDLFSRCSALNNISGLEKLNVSNVTDFTGMFYSTSITDLSSLTDWDMQSANTIEGMFNGCSNITNVQPLLSWNLTNITNVAYLLNASGRFGVVTGSYALYQKLSNIPALTSLESHYSCFTGVLSDGGTIPIGWKNAF